MATKKKKPAKPADVITKLLATVSPHAQYRGALGGKPELVAAIVGFLDLKAARDPRAHVTLAWLYAHKLRNLYDGPSFDAVRRYVRDVLRRSITTGKQL